MSTKRFIAGFLATAALFVAINLLSAHFMSECGLPALLGASGCADNIVRAGFPFQFYKKGGFAYRYEFSNGLLALDIGLGLAVAAAIGWWWSKRK